MILLMPKTGIIACSEEGAWPPIIEAGMDSQYFPEMAEDILKNLGMDLARARSLSRLARIEILREKLAILLGSIAKIEIFIYHAQSSGLWKPQPQ